MQRLDVIISAAATDPLKLTFTAADTAEQIAERVSMITWLVRQLDGHASEPRRRGVRQERMSASAAEKTAVES